MFAQKLIVNAKIYTMDDQYSYAEKMAVRNGRIVGFDKEAEKFVNDATEFIDVEGQIILPGFIESHGHPLTYANNQLGLELNAAVTPTIDAILDAVRERAKIVPEGEWILGSGWDDERMPERRFPTIEELDEAAPNHPVFLKRTCVHNAVANTLAFQKSNLSNRPEDPEGGHFDINEETNKVSGLVQENAMDLFLISSVSIEQQKKAMLAAQNQFFKWGITAIHDMAVTKDVMKVYQQLQEEKDFRLKMRLWLWGIDQMGWTGVENEAIALGLESGFGNDYLNIQGMKYMLDGSVGGKTAAVAEPFENDGDNRGILYMSQEKINKHVKKAVDSNFRISIHGIGERALDMALEAITSAETKEASSLKRHRIEHVTLATEEHMKKMAEYKIVAASSVGFIYSIGDSYIANLGEKRVERVFPHASFKKHGLVAPGNSDLPVCDGNPMYGIYAAVTRKTIGGQQMGTIEAISVEDAFKAYTMDAAYSGFDEKIIGSLSKGKYADFIIVDKNPFEIHADELKDVQVQQTFVEGESVYTR